MHRKACIVNGKGLIKLDNIVLTIIIDYALIVSSFAFATNTKRLCCSDSSKISVAMGVC